MVENVNTISGSDSERDTSGSIGSADGTSGNGSGGNVDGSGGNVDGSGGRLDGSADGNGSADDNGNSGIDSAEQSSGEVGYNVKSTDGTVDDNGNRSERIKRRRPVRLGSAVRDRDTDTATDSGSGSADFDELDSENPIRLGARKQARPRAKVDTDSATGEIKFSEIKDLISMFLDIVFEVPATTLKQDFWRLSKDENKMLTDAIGEYVKSMPKSKSNWFLQFMKEHMPLVNLCMVGFFIVSDRAKKSIAIAQVTKAGKAFDLGSAPKSTETHTPSSANVKTPLDSMFGGGVH